MGNYSITYRPWYSVVSEFGIECKSVQTGLIGTSFTTGVMIGCTTFGFLIKFIPSKIMITASLLVYAVCLVIMAWARNYVVFCICIKATQTEQLASGNIRSGRRESPLRSIFMSFSEIGRASCRERV